MAIQQLHHIEHVKEQWGLAALVDVETTGLSRRYDEIIELAIVLFAFDRNTGQIKGIVDEYAGLRDPGRPIPAEATAVHGIRDRDVKGKRLDDLYVRRLISQAEFCVAHNASFDRAFVERLYLDVVGRPWLCSMSDVPWKQKGFASRGLQELLRNHGIIPPKAHRSAADARATLQLLACADSSGVCYFKYVLDRRAGRVSAAQTGVAGPAKHARESRCKVCRPLRIAWLLVRSPFTLVWWVLRLPIRLVTWPFRRSRSLSNRQKPRYND